MVRTLPPAGTPLWMHACLRRLCLQNLSRGSVRMVEARFEDAENGGWELTGSFVMHHQLSTPYRVLP